VTRFQKIFFIVILSAWVLSCQRIEKGEDLPSEIIAQIQKMQLLDKDEQIILYYSSLTKKLSGNFITEKRIASYWIDEHDSSKTGKVFALYKDITSLDTNYMKQSIKLSPYILVTVSNGKKFKVYVDGKHDEVKRFFETAIEKWRSAKK
jgi:hypothetical protein